MNSILSKDNKLVRHVCKLRDSSRYRFEHLEAVIYGEHLVVEAIRYGILKTLIINNDTLISHLDLQNIEVFQTNQLVLNKISNLDSDINIVGIICFNEELVNERLFNSDCIVLDNIQDPGNVGTILRVARASGFKNIVLSNDSVDIYNPKVIRASQGVQFGLSIVYVNNIVDFLNQYNGISIATVPNAMDHIYKFDLKNNKIAWVFGNEGRGVSDLVLDAVDVKLSIPMSSNVESLNVAMASSICLFETYRQREFV